MPDYAGIRPKLTGPGEKAADFVIDGPAEHGLTGLVQLFGIESPGLTSCLALADDVARRPVMPERDSDRTLATARWAMSRAATSGQIVAMSASLGTEVQAMANSSTMPDTDTDLDLPQIRLIRTSHLQRR